ncbi:MAG: c-type cytochrome [Acidobacteria bacterium]|nr:c-type cytochrome [Acidobacteriota bacterium]
MARRMLVAVVALAISAGAAQAQTIKKVPIKRTSPADAKQMFDSYCAVCHGKDGKGTGPAAKALTKAPADLTKISARNGGVFPDVRVKRFIEGLDELPAHGTRDMPMWGELFRSLDRGTDQLRIMGLSEYLKSLQQQ